MGYTVAVVGATGAVGAQMIKMLEESTLPIDKIRYLASARSAGKVLQFKGQDVTIEETTEDAFEGVDIALFSAGGSTSAKYAPYAVKAGAVVVDNTSYFRQNPDVPLVVPEVNAHALDAHNGIIACPNCSTIQMMVAPGQFVKNGAWTVSSCQLIKLYQVLVWEQSLKHNVS